MALNTNSSRRIQILREDVALKIAAGEVIDRPFSVIRELLDNSIDADSNEITLYLDKGGIEHIRVVDNGLGMDESDLKLCFLPHATSKITEEKDLYLTTTLGFRGEALSSIANCSKLDITSCPRGSSFGNKLIVRAGKLLSCEKYQARHGTIVDVSDLFYNMPARKKFLKSASGETSVCKIVFLDKAAAFPETTFRLFLNEKLTLFLPATSRLERITNAYKDALDKQLMFETEAVFEDFSITVIGSRVELTKSDRRYIQIFVNNRRISEYALIQAVQYGYAEHISGNHFPVAFVFIQINPQLIDFNIHPAKKECKFLNLPEIHQALVALIKSSLSQFSINLSSPPPPNLHKQAGFENFSVEPGTVPVIKMNHAHTADVFSNKLFRKDYPQNYQENKSTVTLPAEKEEIKHATGNIKYLGQAFNLFLIAEYNDQLFIVDQHAAHEKILFNKYKSNPPVMQELIFPVAFETEENTGLLLEKDNEILKECGIELVKTGNNLFEITGLSTNFQLMETNTIVEYLQGLKGGMHNLETELFSMLACKSAIKDGDVIDPLTAINLLRETFVLENARCPHGRPIWHVLNHDTLFKLMGRK